MNSDDDALNNRFVKADRAIRRSRLDAKIRELSGIIGGPATESGDTSDLDVGFLERVIAWEEGPFSTHRAWLARQGFMFSSPESVEPSRLKHELWRSIESLAEVARVFLYHTNHLSDAELYAKIWSEVLENEGPDFARTQDDACHHDFADYSTGSAEDERTWLTFYASEDERREHLQNFPETQLPPRKCTPFRRNHRLPVRD